MTRRPDEPLSPVEAEVASRLRHAADEAADLYWPFNAHDVIESVPTKSAGGHPHRALLRRLPGGRWTTMALVAAVILAVFLVPVPHVSLLKHLVTPAKPSTTTSVPARILKRAQSSELSAVSCISATACTAVGSRGDVRLAEGWNGAKWSVEPMASQAESHDSSLSSVSCASTSACVAVGSYDNVTLAQAWNGTTWAIKPTPNPIGSRRSSLSAVSCTSATRCVAVGSYDNSAGDGATLAEAWNGTTWAIQPTPNPRSSKGTRILLLGLSGISCTAAAACTAVGGYSYLGDYLTLAEGWNGRRWAIEPTPNVSGSTLSSVSCTAATACTAVGGLSGGSYFTRVEVWNGETWVMKYGGVASGGDPPFSDFAGFLGVSCTSATACVVVGSSSVGTLAEAWNGRTLTYEPTAAGGVSFLGVSCPSVTTCTAVGSHENSADSEITLAEAWNGKKWAVEPSTPAAW
jgi:hypothetical protein